MKTDDNKEILKRLDTIVFLLLELKDKDGKMPIIDKVKLLSDAGLDYNQIANVLGKTPGHIAVNLTNLKKLKASKKDQKEDESRQVD